MDLEKDLGLNSFFVFPLSLGLGSAPRAFNKLTKLITLRVGIIAVPVLLS